MVARTIGHTTDSSIVEAIHETCRTHECRKFGRKFTTYPQLSYADRTSKIWLIINNYMPPIRIVLLFTYTQITLEKL